ncbi:unnamed protein product [Amoebophrya sp. A25]|nr:unnamed protein product [Amoebophrya sp. A25]|eukprot:GSA25T00004590001.1
MIMSTKTKRQNAHRSPPSLKMRRHRGKETLRCSDHSCARQRGSNLCCTRQKLPNTMPRRNTSCGPIRGTRQAPTESPRKKMAVVTKFTRQALGVNQRALTYPRSLKCIPFLWLGMGRWLVSIRSALLTNTTSVAGATKDESSTIIWSGNHGGGEDEEVPGEHVIRAQKHEQELPLSSREEPTRRSARTTGGLRIERADLHLLTGVKTLVKNVQEDEDSPTEEDSAWPDEEAEERHGDQAKARLEDKNADEMDEEENQNLEIVESLEMLAQDVKRHGDHATAEEEEMTSDSASEDEEQKDGKSTRRLASSSSSLTATRSLTTKINWCPDTYGGESVEVLDVATNKHTEEHTGDGVWAVKAVKSVDLSIIVTPLSQFADPDVSIYGQTISSGSDTSGEVANSSTSSTLSSSSSCRFVQRAMDFGGDVLRLPRGVAEEAGYKQYYVHVRCSGFSSFFSPLGFGSLLSSSGSSSSSPSTTSPRRSLGEHQRSSFSEDLRDLTSSSSRSSSCKYHVSITAQSFTDEIVGTRSGVAYLGVSQNFVYNVPKDTGSGAHLTVSLYPRDAIAVQHGGLKLLVNDNEIGSTKTSFGNYRAQPGWFGGEVVNVPVLDKKSVYFSVLKKKLKDPVPFVLSVQLNDGPVKLTPHAPVWDLVSKRQTKYYTLEVTRPNLDVSVYVTPVTGDPTLVCDAGLNKKPRPGNAMWEEHHPGGESLYILANDPKRLRAGLDKPGNFTIGVYGTTSSTYSLMAILDPHVDPTSDEGKADQALGPTPMWSELYLGMPQRLSVRQGKTSHTLFFNMLDRKYIEVVVSADRLRPPSSSDTSVSKSSNGGAVPGAGVDICITKCGTDPHNCAEKSPFGAGTTPNSEANPSTGKAAKAASSSSGDGADEAEGTSTTTTVSPRAKRRRGLREGDESKSAAVTKENMDWSGLSPTGRNVSVATCVTTIKAADTVSGPVHALIPNPCPQCWYALLATPGKGTSASSEGTSSSSSSSSSSTQTQGRTDFTVTMSASGSEWHPLTLKEPFWGHVDAGGADVKLSFELFASDIAGTSCKLQFELVPLHGTPQMTITELTKENDETSTEEDEDSSSSASTELSSRKKTLATKVDSVFETAEITSSSLTSDSSSLAVGAKKPSKRRVFQIRVRAKGPQHAQFRLVVVRKGEASSGVSSSTSGQKADATKPEFWSDLPIVAVGESKSGFLTLPAGEPEFSAFFVDGTQSESVLLATDPPLPIAVEVAPSEFAPGGAASASVSQSSVAKLPSLGTSPWRTTLKNKADPGGDPLAETLVIKPQDSQYQKNKGAYYVVGVFPKLHQGNSLGDSASSSSSGGAAGGVRYRLQVRSFKEDVFNELLPDQPAIRGSIEKKEVIKYALTIGPPPAGTKHRRHIVLSLVVFSGDADLYAGFTKSVSRQHHTFASSRYGSDAIFITGFSDKNRCAPKFERGEDCVLYVLVYGYGKATTYALSATTPDGKPVELLSTLEGKLLKGMRQFYYTDFSSAAASAASSSSSSDTVARVSIVPQKGDPDLYCVLTDLETAKDPPAEFADIKTMRKAHAMYKRYASFKASGNEILRIARSDCPAASHELRQLSKDQNGIKDTESDRRRDDVSWPWFLSRLLSVGRSRSAEVHVALDDSKIPSVTLVADGRHLAEPEGTTAIARSRSVSTPSTLEKPLPSWMGQLYKKFAAAAKRPTWNWLAEKLPPEDYLRREMGSTSKKCAIFCAVYAFSNTTYQIGVTFEEDSRSSTTSSSESGSSSSSSLSGSSSSGSSSSSSASASTSGVTALTSGVPSIGMVLKDLHTTERFRFRTSDPNALITVTPLMDCHVVTSIKGIDYHRRQIPLTGLTAGESLLVKVSLDPERRSELLCMFEVKAQSGAGSGNFLGSSDSASSSSHTSSGDRGKTLDGVSGSSSSSATTSGPLFPTLYTENDSYKKAKLSRLANGIPFIGSTAVGKGFEEQRFIYSPENCDLTEIRIVPFSGDMLVFRKKPGSTDSGAGTEVWYSVPRGVVDDGSGSAAAAGGSSSSSTSSDGSRSSSSSTSRSGSGDDNKGSSRSSINADIAASKNSLLEYFVLKPGRDKNGQCEDMKFLVRRIHGTMYADYSVTAFEDGADRPRFETLPSDVPSYMQFPGKTRRFSLFVNSAVTKQTLKLQCRPHCAGMELSAGMTPDDNSEKTWKTSGREEDQVLTLSLKDQSKSRNYGFYPRVVYAWVSQRNDESHGVLVHASLVATSDSVFELLLDGGEAVVEVARPNEPAYFAFDAPRATPLLTIIGKLPYDEENDLYNTKVQMWVQDCVDQAQLHIEDPESLPGSKSHDVVGRLNSRNQLVAFVDNSHKPTTTAATGKTKPLSSLSKHCFYRVGITTSRPGPVRVTVRGGTTRKNAPLRVNGPSQVGILRDKYPESYILVNHLTREELRKAKVLVHYEPCQGKISPHRPPVEEMPGDSDEPIKLACEGDNCKGRFLLRATSMANSWEYRPGKLSKPEKGWRHGNYELEWTVPRRRHYQSDQRKNEAFGEIVEDVWYEVFIIPVSTEKPIFDDFHPTSCGCYNMIGKVPGVQRQMFSSKDLSFPTADTVKAKLTAHYAPARGEHFDFVLIARDGQTDEKFAYPKVSLADDESDGVGDFTGDPLLNPTAKYGNAFSDLASQPASFLSRLSFVLFVLFVILTSLCVCVRYGRCMVMAVADLGSRSIARSHLGYAQGPTSVFELRPTADVPGGGAPMRSGYEPPNAIGVGYNRIE